MPDGLERRREVSEAYTNAAMDQTLGISLHLAKRAVNRIEQSVCRALGSVPKPMGRRNRTGPKELCRILQRIFRSFTLQWPTSPLLYVEV